MEYDGFTSSFNVESNGSILVAKELDYESNTTLPITIKGTEGNRTQVHQFIVSILDVNESEPPINEPDPFEFTTTELSVSEDAEIGSEIGYVYRTSGDQNESVVFSLEYDGFSSSFSVESNGSILVAKELDYESNTTLPITIKGTEGNRTQVHQFIVSILDVDESEPPISEPDPFEFNATILEVPENSPVGTVIGYIYRTSGDESQTVLFSSLNNTLPILVQENGTVIVESSIDYEQNTSYIISVSGTQGEERIIRTFTVDILDIDETVSSGPQPDPFGFDATSLSVPENVHIGTYVGEVFRTSGNMELNATYNFEGIIEGDFPFSLESNGTIFVSAFLDYERKSSYLVHIRGQEGDRAVLRQFLISVEDVFEIGLNEAPSDISLSPKEIIIKGNRHAREEIGVFSAIDNDLNDQHVFSFVDGEGDEHNPYFTIERNGSLFTNAVLDLGVDQNLSLLIQVTDSSGSGLQKQFTILYEHQEPGEDIILISQGADVAKGWKRAGWFGYYFSNFYPWIYHENLGWVYVMEKDYFGTWFFRDRMGWSWTSSETFPSLYLFDKDEWTFLNTDSRFTVLFDYQRVEWFELDRDFEVAGLSIPSVGGYVSGYGVFRRGDMVNLKAIPEQGYLFDKWSGDLSGENPLISFQVYSDFKIEALFKKIISEKNSPIEAVNNAVEAVNQLEGLSDELKQKAIVELLLTGQSATADIPPSE